MQTTQEVYHAPEPASTHPAPTWYRTPAEKQAHRKRAAELYAAYLAAEGYEAITAAWQAYCDHVDRGVR